MKVIDLLNKIANDEEVPKKIKYYNTIYEYNEQYDYENELQINYYSVNKGEDFFNEVYCYSLNDEIEILEEEKEIPGKLECFNLTTYSRDDKDLGLELHYTGVSNTFNDVYFKINEIIDYLKSKGD